MTSEFSTRMRSGQTWLRLALMIIYFFVVYTVVRLLVGISMLFQFVHQLVKGSQATIGLPCWWPKLLYCCTLCGHKECGM